MSFSIIMENEKDEMSNSINNEKTDSSERESEVKEKAVAKDLVKLKHIEVQKKDVSQDIMDLANAMKEKGLDQDSKEKLTNDEITVLESFVGKRLFLRRIAIVVNQSRVPLGLEPFKKEDLEKLLDRLIHKEYIDFDVVNDERVYFLTEKGKEKIQ